MKPAQKLLGILAVIGLAVAVQVTVSHAQFAPTRAIALPLGVLSLGLVLISLLVQKEQLR